MTNANRQALGCLLIAVLVIAGPFLLGAMAGIAVNTFRWVTGT